MSRSWRKAAAAAVIAAALGLGVWWNSNGGGPGAAPGTGPGAGSSMIVLKAVVHERDGSPIAGALLRTRNGLLTATTDKGGRAEVELHSGLVPDLGDVQVSKQGYHPRSLPIPTPDHGTSTVDVVLDAASPLRRLAVRVVTPSGDAIPGMRLLFGVLDPADGAVGPEEVVVAGPDGLFDISVYDEASVFRLEAADDGWVTYDYPVILAAAEWPASSGVYQLIAQPVSALAVSIHAAGGGGEPAAFVILLPDWAEDGGRAWTSSERSAAFQYAGMPRIRKLPGALVLQQVPRGRYRLVASRLGGCLVESRVTVEAGEGLREIHLAEPEWESVPARITTAEGAPVQGAIIGPYPLRLNDWTQLLNSWFRLNLVDPLRYVLHGEAEGVAAERSLAFLRDAGWGVTDEEGRAELRLPRGGGGAASVFVPGRGLAFHDFRAEVVLHLPPPAAPEIRIEGPPRVAGGGARVLAWVENPFPPGAQYPEPVPTGFLTLVGEGGGTPPPLLPAGRYRAAVMDIGREMESQRSGKSVPLEVGPTGVGFPERVSLSER